MRLSTVLLMGVFLCTIMGTLDSVWKRLGIFKGYPAGGSLLLLAVSGFQVPLGGNVSVNPASALLLLGAVLLLIGTGDGGMPVLLAILGAIFGWVCYSASPAFPETGILVALPGCLLSLTQVNPRKGMACTLLSPMAFGMIAFVEDWYLFDLLQIPLGNALQLDAQVFGTLLGLLLRQVPNPFLKAHWARRRDTLRQ